MIKLDFKPIRENTKSTNMPSHENRELDGHAVERPLSTQLVNSYAQEQIEHERSLAIFKEYQKNIKASEEMQARILKGIRTGEPPTVLLLKAAKCISLMTSNEVFYNQMESDILSIYGFGLSEPEALQPELDRINNQLKRLEEARNRETGDSKKRIEAAIKSHMKRAAELEILIGSKTSGNQRPI